MQIRSRLAFRSPISYSIATVLALFAMIMLAACGESPTPTPGVTPTVTAQANAGTPPDLTVTYEYRAGTMPPPYHNEYTVVIGPGTQGMVKYSPDYPGDTTPIWDELFSPTAEQLNQLYALILKNNLLRSGWRELDMPPVGGDTEWAGKGDYTRERRNQEDPGRTSNRRRERRS